MRHKIKFPQINEDNLEQDEAFFYLNRNNKDEKLLFHDYDTIYNEPNLYEQLFYDRLKCSSPQKIVTSLEHTINQNKEHFSELKILDFGAGNGMVGEQLKKIGVARLVGVDILHEAKKALDRDRPGIYDDYYVRDFTELNDTDREEIKAWNLNCLISVAALGFGDIPPKAFIEALNLISSEAWVAFNIKETFLFNSDISGFSKLIRELISSGHLFINHLERYRHRISIDGSPLFYFSIVCWKNSDISPDFVNHIINE
ncbi:MAG: class I SAM-dependent methyltransferase [Spirochaetota bacterium]|nr:class I SAM-dependent methyltransferase [Spirochaetota bacterium]